MTCKDEKESFVMYASFLKAAECLNGEDFKECILKLRDYALYGEDSESENQLVNTILIMAKPNLRAAADRYQRCVDNGMKGKEFGSKGGRPKKGETREEYEERKGLGKTPRKPLNDNVNDTGNENIKENIDDNENEKVNLIKEVPSGQGTSTVPKPSSFSFFSSSDNSNLPETATGASNSRSVETKDITPLNSPQASSNASATGSNAIKDSNEEYQRELRGYLILMAKYALGLIRLEDFDEILEQAIRCYMDYNGVSKAKAAKEIEQGIMNYKEGLQNRSQGKKYLEEIDPVEEEEENDEPF